MLMLVYAGVGQAAAAKAFAVARMSLAVQLRELAYNIKQKEELIQALQRNESEAKQLSQHYLVRENIIH